MENQEVSKKFFSKKRSKYLTIGSGVTHINYRDLATSPLYYKGWVPSFIVGYEASDDFLELTLKVESAIDIPILSNYGFRVSSEGNFNISRFSKLAINYSVLRKVDRFSSERLNVKVGGIIDVNTLLRSNINLGNNSIGVDIFPTIFASAKATYIFKGLLNNNFIRSFFALGNKLSYRLDVPIFFGNIRNSEFVYIDDRSIYSDSMFYSYDFKPYQGFRLRSMISYDFHASKRRNGNMFRISYMWNIYMTKKGEHPEQFVLGTNSLFFSMLFNL